ncbi:MAG TPA: serine hydrolase [bacterium]|nr:serine hydrolase [bacterium]
MRWIGALCVVLVSVGAGVPAGAQDAPPAGLQQIVDQVVQPAMAKGGIPGAAVGISLRGHTYVFPYGRANDRGHAFTADTLVEIGSCTKVFTATLLALAADAHQLSLDDSIQKYMPSGATLTPSAQHVTLLQLATMSAGMPRFPTNLPDGLANDSIDHYTTRDFFAFVSRWEPRGPLPAPYLYSNAGFGLIGYLVADATGTPWEQAVDAQILAPLGMSDTEAHPSVPQRQRLADGFTANGRRAPEWPVFAWYAAGALRSTVRDRLRFGEANLGHTMVAGMPVPPALTAAMTLAQQSHGHVPGMQFDQALAWEVLPEEGAVLKDGGTTGFSTVLVLNRAKDLVVFVVANSGSDVPIDAMGLTLARTIR